MILPLAGSFMFGICNVTPKTTRVSIAATPSIDSILYRTEFGARFNEANTLANW